MNNLYILPAILAFSLGISCKKIAEDNGGSSRVLSAAPGNGKPRAWRKKPVSKKKSVRVRKKRKGLNLADPNSVAFRNGNILPISLLIAAEHPTQALFNKADNGKFRSGGPCERNRAAADTIKSDPQYQVLCSLIYNLKNNTAAQNIRYKNYGFKNRKQRLQLAKGQDLITIDIKMLNREDSDGRRVFKPIGDSIGDPRYSTLLFGGSIMSNKSTNFIDSLIGYLKAKKKRFQGRYLAPYKFMVFNGCSSDTLSQKLLDNNILGDVDVISIRSGNKGDFSKMGEEFYDSIMNLANKNSFGELLGDLEETRRPKFGLTEANDGFELAGNNKKKKKNTKKKGKVSKGKGKWKIESNRRF